MELTIHESCYLRQARLHNSHDVELATYIISQLLPHEVTTLV